MLASGAMWISGDLLHLAYPQDPPCALVYYLDYPGRRIQRRLPGRAGGAPRASVDSHGRLGRAGYFLAFAGAALAFLGHAASGIFPQNGTLGSLFRTPASVSWSASS
jgi:hypothetical protein